MNYLALYYFFIGFVEHNSSYQSSKLTNDYSNIDTGLTIQFNFLCISTWFRKHSDYRISSKIPIKTNVNRNNSPFNEINCGFQTESQVHIFHIKSACLNRSKFVTNSTQSCFKSNSKICNRDYTATVKFFPLRFSYATYDSYVFRSWHKCQRAKGALDCGKTSKSSVELSRLFR